MNFKVYQIIQLTTKQEDWLQITNTLAKTRFFAGEHNLRFCLNKEYTFNEDEGIYIGSLHEEYLPDQTSVTDQQEEAPIENIDPWERTLFAIDFSNQKLLIQQRDYAPRNLNRNQARIRISSILNAVWDEIFGTEFNYIPTNLSLGNDYFIDNFIRNTRVLGIKLSFGNARIVTATYDGSDIPNGGFDIWNEDMSGMNDLSMKTATDGDLHDSPFFKLALSSPDVVIESVTYFNSITDKVKVESRSQFDQIEVTSITKRSEVITALHEIFSAMLENRTKLATLRAINLG